MYKTLITALLALVASILHASPITISPNIKIDQFGYRPLDAKFAIIAKPQIGAGAPSSYNPSVNFKIRRWNDDVEVFSGNLVAWNNGATQAQSGDKVWWFDFSNLTTNGDYYVYDPVNNVGSYKFQINENIYTNVFKVAQKALFYQRCGTALSPNNGVTWHHAACHIANNQDVNCRLVTDKTNIATTKNLSGGWHDAGDYNKYVNYSYVALHNLLFAYQETPSVFGDNLNIPESQNGVPDILDEIKYELDWLVKMQQNDGSVLSKVAVIDFSDASPPNNDAANRYYGAASTSSTLTVASVFAHAYVVFKDIPTYATYAQSLKTKAELAWTWAANNPSVIFTNTGFQSSNPEIDSYERAAVKTCAAAMLFAATANTIYKTYFETNYTTLHPYVWSYFYTFEGTYGDILLYYANLQNTTPSVSSNIRNHFSESTNSNGDFFINYNSKADAYRAFMKDEDYVWGNNQHKALLGVMYENMIKYNIKPVNDTEYRTQSLDYLHFLHGVNPLNYVMISNTGNIGASKPVMQIYHAWTGDGTPLDNNPIPGLMTGGYNKNYSGNNNYFNNQPILKHYLDWNTSYPENSWEITEPSISYQSAYIRLVAKYASLIAVGVKEPQIKKELIKNIYPNPVNNELNIETNDLTGAVTINVYNIKGQLVLTKKIETLNPNEIIKLKVANLADGTYALQLIHGNTSQIKYVEVNH